VPEGQGRQEVVPPTEYVPVLQGMGDDDVDGHSNPGPHVTHVAHASSEYVPLVQLVIAPVVVQR